MSNIENMNGRPMKLSGKRYNLRLVSTGNVVQVKLYYNGGNDQKQLFHVEYQSFPEGGSNPLSAPTIGEVVTYG